MPTKRPNQPRKRSSAPRDGSPLGHLSDEELLQELARRRVIEGNADLSVMEDAAEAAKQTVGKEALAAMVAALPPEIDEPKPCPGCGHLVAIKSRHRQRRILTLSGELTISRHYHYCGRCKRGFYPRDAELSLPQGGDVSLAMERRILR